MLGKHSGRHALAKRCEDLGHPLTREQLDMMYHRFTALADRKKGLRNDEIAALAASDGRDEVARDCGLAWSSQLRLLVRTKQPARPTALHYES